MPSELLREVVAVREVLAQGLQRVQEQALALLADQVADPGVVDDVVEDVGTTSARILGSSASTSCGATSCSRWGSRASTMPGTSSCSRWGRRSARIRGSRSSTSRG